LVDWLVDWWAVLLVDSLVVALVVEWAVVMVAWLVA
jgi:hypothetical protein